MSHRWDCPTDYEARRKADRDAEDDLRYGRSYRNPYDCDEANEAYRGEYNYRFNRLEEEVAERRQVERRLQARREEEEMERSYFEQQQQEEDYRRQEEEQQELPAPDPLCANCAPSEIR